MTNSTEALDIDFLSDLTSEDLAPIGPAARVYDLQLQAERAQRTYEVTYSNTSRRLEDLERQAGPGRSAFGMSSLLDMLERDPEVVKAKAVAQERAALAEQAQAEIGGIVFLPPVTYLPALEKKFASLNRRADRTGDEHGGFTVTDERILLEYTYAQDYDRGYSAKFEHAFIIVKPVTPKIPGFEFIATVTHGEKANLVNKIPALRFGIRHNLQVDGAIDPKTGREDTSPAEEALEAIDLTPYRTSEPYCDHCHTNRHRKETFIVYSEAEGKLLQIGRNCLRDYTGIDSAERLVKRLEQYRELFGNMRSARGEEPLIPTLDYLTHVACMIRIDGGYRKKDWDIGTSPSAVNNYWNLLSEATDSKGKPLYVVPNDWDKQAAERVLAWVQTWDEDGDFPHNVRTALSGAVIPAKGHGYAAAAFPARDRAEGRKQARKEREERNATKGHVGTIKERTTFQVTLKSVKWIEDRYSYDGGSKPLIIMEDDQGNEIKWFASSFPRVEDRHFDFESGQTKDRDGKVYGTDLPIEGGTYEIKATVVDHEDHERFGKSTKINRAKFLKTINEPQED